MDGDRVTDDAIRRYIIADLREIANRDTPDAIIAKGIIIKNDGTWQSNETHWVEYGEWYVDGPDLDIIVVDDD
jgi:hypothetical protein